MKSRQAYHFKDFTLDLDRGCLWRGTEEVKLRPKVFEALSYLVRNNDRLVPKDELIKALWTETFVTDDSLVQCLVELRRALGDEANACLKTVPRRGYVFTAAVSVAPPSEEMPVAPLVEPTAAAQPRRSRAGIIAFGGLAIAVAALSYAWLARPRAAPLTDKDSVLIADFVNTTGDEVFDGTLRQAVAVHLEQSPFLDVFPEERIRETLRYMGRPPTEPVTRDVAREIAQRRGVKAVLAGSIATLGRNYVISLEAVNATTGDAFAREQVEAESRERVLARLGEAATRLRERMGESLGSIEQFAAPVEQATTPSLEAFKAYSLGRQRHFSGQYFEAIPLYRRAVELDPSFAIAYAALGITYGSAQEYDLAAQSSQRAYELRERVSERERLYISVRYFVDVLDDTDRAIEALELWKQTYPRDFVPRTNLSARYSAIGRHERAHEEAREGLRLNPDAGVAYAGVAHSAIHLGRYAEARSVLEQALQRGLEPPHGRFMLYGISFLERDEAGMQEQIDRVSGTTAEAGMLALQSVTAVYAGKLSRAEELTGSGVELALQRGLKESAGLYSAGDALWEAAYGQCRRSRRAVARTLDLTRGRRAVSWSALAAALCGESRRAEELAGELAQRHPQSSFVRTSWLPLVQAALALHRNDPAAAISLLKAPGRVEMGTNAALWPVYLRGLAYLEQGGAADAQAEFQKILDNRGTLAPKDFNPVAMALYPLASLGRARALAQSGDVPASRKAYEELFALWKDADADLDLLRVARKEYARLETAPAPRVHQAGSRRNGSAAAAAAVPLAHPM
jgi:DNA-binding winged helix-turn-helix (wHTH) protein/tetratricopeptide (TPR) repeat protein